MLNEDADGVAACLSPLSGTGREGGFRECGGGGALFD